MLLDYNIFYRTFGLRRVEQLMSPRFGHMDHFQLPRRSIVHLAHGNPAKFGPTEQEVSLQGFTSAIVKEGRILQKAVARPVYIYHRIQMAAGVLGNPIKQTAQPNVMIRQYQQTYRRFRSVIDPERVLADNASLMVYNYDMLPHLVRYPRGPANHFYEWYNIERTMWDEIAKTAMKTDRPQFVVRHMPQVLPARSQLQLFEAMKPSAPANRLLSIFNTPERLFLAEMWKWFGLHRKQSLISLVPRDKLSRVNIVFIESGKWTTINLGMLDSWRKPMEDELLPDEVIKTNLFDPVKYQNRALRFFMSITQLRTVASAEVTDLANQVLDGDDAEELKKEATAAQQAPATVTKVATGAATVDTTTGQAKVKTEIIRTHLNDVLDDKPDDTAETVRVDAALDDSIDADLAELEKLQTDTEEAEPEKVLEVRKSFETVAQVINVPVPELKRLSHDEALLKIAQGHMNNGSLSAAQYRHYETLAKVYKTLDAPDNTMKIEEFITIPPEALKIEESSSIPDIATVPDKTMLRSSLLDFDKRYTQTIMQRDVASMVMCFAQAGYAVTNYEVEEINNLMGSFRMYTVRVQPVDGVASTIRFKLPVIDPDGSYTSNGVKYNLRKQRVEIPIVKVSPDTVALTSYYGKAFVRRSEKRVNNYAMWLTNQIMAKMLDDADEVITEGHPGDMSDNLFKGPRLYTTLASGFSSFKLKPVVYPRSLGQTTFDMSFDHTKREALYGKEAMERLEVNGAVIAGKSGNGNLFVIQADNTCWAYGKGASSSLAETENAFPLGSFEGLAGLPAEKAPVDIAVMKISNATIPLGVILAYEMGLEPMLAKLRSKIRRVPAGQRLNLVNEEAVVFNDESIIYSKNDRLTGLFLGGFNEYDRHIRRYNSHLFNKKEVYLNILEAGGLGVRYIREMDLFYQLFIDPITHDLLVEMHEPTEMIGLLIRAGSLLLTDDHPDEQDGLTLRLRGYERMAGAVYSEMVRSIRSHNGSAGKSRTPLNMDPYAVFTAVQTDASKAQVNDINPIQNLKEQEAVTYNGTGGRNSRTMTKKTRTYHRNDMGVISGDTVDSSDVAINTYTSADPQFTSLRGLSKPYESTIDPNATCLLSTSALLSPASDRDDPKRVNFIGIQNSHVVACNGYHQMPVRTGYEQVVAHRVSDMYAATAPQDGVVTSVAPTGIIVQFKDGTKQGYEIGRRFGNAAGLTIPHEIVSNVKLGQEFKRGAILIYNSGFFEPDNINPSNVVWKAGLLVKTVLMEIPETLEDSSAISPRIAERMVTKISKYSDIVVTFDQAVNKLVKVGQAVSSEDILCIIEDAVTSRADLFDAESLDTLKNLSNLAPQAKVRGVVERIEVYYHGDKEDMSPSLVAIANASDKEFAERFKSTGRKVLTGSVDEAFRVEGEPLQLDQLCIRVYITSEMAMGEGDKGVFANQGKSVVGKKMAGSYRTESGEELDAVFGAISIENRIIHSPYIIGMTTVLLDLHAQEAVDAYES